MRLIKGLWLGTVEEPEEADDCVGSVATSVDWSRHSAVGPAARSLPRYPEAQVRSSDDDDDEHTRLANLGCAHTTRPLQGCKTYSHHSRTSMRSHFPVIKKSTRPSYGHDLQILQLGDATLQDVVKLCSEGTLMSALQTSFVKLCEMLVNLVKL